MGELTAFDVPQRALVLVHPSQFEMIHDTIARLGVFPVHLSPNTLVQPGRVIVIPPEQADSWRMSRR